MRADQNKTHSLDWPQTKRLVFGSVRSFIFREVQLANLDDRQAAEFIQAVGAEINAEINNFNREVFRTRGGRMGSGMGLLLEGLWAYYAQQKLDRFGIDIAWLAEDQYNDYAVTPRGGDWDPATRRGELLRIEAKSMNLGAAETKGHFAELERNIMENDLLLVLLWRWVQLDGSPYVAPQVVDSLLERAKPIAQLRDELHLARGGTFVDSNNCPDGCPPEKCVHDGEPLNAAGKRERLSGPDIARPSLRVSFAANFGGLKRMIAGRNREAREVREQFAKSEPAARRYIDFMQLERG